MANVVYRPLLDAEAIQVPADGGGPSDDKSDGKDAGGGTGDDTDEDKDENKDEDKNEDIRNTIEQIRTDPAPESLIFLAQAESDGADGEAEQPERQPVVRRILELIVEIREADSDLKKEASVAVGDESRRDNIKIKRTQQIELFQQKLANLRIDVSRENSSKAEIIQRLYLAARHIGSGVADLKELIRVSSRNRDLERVIARLEYKGRMFTAAYQNLRQAAEQDAKAQSDAYTLLDRALDELRGWHTGRDIGEALRAMYMMKPGTESVSEGLRTLLKGLDVEADLDIILRAGGEPGA
jgi:hypothetical protein